MILVYTDLLLDDLCALEVLADWCKSHNNSVHIVVEKAEDLGASEYASDKVRSAAEAVKYFEKWFGKRYTLQFGQDPLPELGQLDAVLELAPATSLVQHIKSGTVKGCTIFVMGGSERAKDHVGDEWNAMQDPEAHKYLVNLANKNDPTRPVVFYTHEDCVDLFARYAYERNPEFLSEYYDKMIKINDYVCCFDLMVVNDIMREKPTKCGTHSTLFDIVENMA